MLAVVRGLSNGAEKCDEWEGVARREPRKGRSGVWLVLTSDILNFF